MKERLACVDGLRGVAVLMVVVYHARFCFIAPPGSPYLVDAAILQGYQGVSLFLVLSGFCLSYPLLQRRSAGEARWFVPSVFFARRCLRILPPYYIAFAYFSVMSMGLAAQGVRIPSIGAPPDLGNLAAHALLIHNLFPAYVFTGNGAFWSLGLEWQWYLVFPFVLLAFVARPRLTVAIILAGVAAWHVLTGDGLQLAVAGRFISAALPARLAEFVFGTVVAQTVVQRRSVAIWPLVAGLASPFLIVHVLPAALSQVAYGVAFACLLLLALRVSTVRWCLEWRPLTSLGIASYSIYLVHEPFMQIIDVVLSRLMAPAAVLFFSCSVGILIGVMFYRLVERPFQQPALRARVLPILLPALAWVDSIRWLRHSLPNDDVVLAEIPG